MKSVSDMDTSDGFQHLRVNLHRRCLIDEVQPQQHSLHPVSLFNPSFYSLKRSAFDPYPHPFPDGRCQPKTYIRLDRDENIPQLPLECILVKNVKEIRNMITLAHEVLLLGLQP